MYIFTSGLVTYDEQTKDTCLALGMKLDKAKMSKMNHLVAKLDNQLVNGDLTKKPIGLDKDIGIKNENNSNNGTIEEKPRRSKKTSK